MDFSVANFMMTKENSSGDMISPTKDEYKKQLAESLLNNNGQKQSRILAFKNKPPPPPEGYNGAQTLYSQNIATGQTKPKKMFRHIPQAPERTLDAPDMLDDYYLNLLDWSSNNVLAVALGMTVYLWDATSSSIEELMTADEEGPITTLLSSSGTQPHFARYGYEPPHLLMVNWLQSVFCILNCFMACTSMKSHL
jgi:cell division cycle protein 20 (cofactor of APC complex)